MKALLTGLAVAATLLLVSCACESPLGYNRGEHPEGSTPVPRAPVIAPEVKAGWADDNGQYNYYLSYLDSYRDPAKMQTPRIDIAGRIVVTVVDRNGKPLHNASVAMRGDRGISRNAICSRKTFTDGRAMFFPHELSGGTSGLTVQATYNECSRTVDVSLAGPQAIEIRLDCDRPAVPQAVPLDIAFVIDSTGSMGDEIDKLKKTLAAIHYKVTEMDPRPDVRFGMVLYRDKGEEYVTRVTDFTGDVGTFARKLNEVKAEKGGDPPEAVNVALAAALHEMKWRPEAVKMAFLLGDAPPHVGDPDEKFTYVDYCHEAAERGIKTTTIGASGLDTQGEYIWRQIAQYTQGLFVFMTYGEKGDSGPDSPWTVSHHTGNNWVSRDLDAIIVQSIARELSHLTAQAVPEFEEYFEARPGKGIDSQAILADLNNECVRQLLNYSQVRLKVGELAAVLPPAAADGCSEKIASAAGEQLQIALARQNFFKLVERTDLKKLMDEKDLAMALDFDKVGKHAAAPASEATTPDAAPDRPLPANLLVLAKVRKSGETYDVYVKMVRVKTGQVVSASMMKINKKLVE